MTDQESEDVGLILEALKVEAQRRISVMELISDEKEFDKAEHLALRCCYLITVLERYLEHGGVK